MDFCVRENFRVTPALWILALWLTVALPSALAGNAMGAMEDDTSASDDSMMGASATLQHSFSEAEISRLAPETLRDFDALAPNTFIGVSTNSPGAGSIFIRGIGASSSDIGRINPVGVVVDGIYQGGNSRQMIHGFDLQQVDVHAGPQGVLDGMHFAGGRIDVRRSRPTGKPGVRSMLEYGSDGDVAFQGVFNMPVFDELALKLGGTHHSRDGFYSNDESANVGVTRYFSAGGALLWTPSDDMQVHATFDHLSDTSDLTPKNYFVDDQSKKFNPFITSEESGVSAAEYGSSSLGVRVDWQLDAGEVYSMTTWLDTTDVVYQDVDAQAAQTLHTQRDRSYQQLTQELRYSPATISLLGRALDTHIGGYLFLSETVSRQGTAYQPPGAAALERTYQHVINDLDLWAMYAGGHWQLRDDLVLNLGARWFNRTNTTQGQYGAAGFAPGLPILPLISTTVGQSAAAPVTLSASPGDARILWQAALNWRIDDNTRAYLSYSEGHRGGGYQAQVVRPDVGGAVSDPVAGEYRDELTFTVEGGLVITRGALNLSLATFHTEVDDPQITFSRDLIAGSVVGADTDFVFSGARARIQGLEAVARLAVHENFTLGVSGGLQNAEYRIDDDDYLRVLGDLDGLLTRPADPANQAAYDTRVAQLLDYLRGNQRAPEWDLALLANFTRQLPQGGTLEMGAVYRGRDDFLLAPSATEPEQQLYWLLDVTVDYTWTTAEGAVFSASLFGRNMLDARYRDYAQPLGHGGAHSWGPPRTTGLRLSLTM